MRAARRRRECARRRRRSEAIAQRRATSAGRGSPTAALGRRWSHGGIAGGGVGGRGRRRSGVPGHPALGGSSGVVGSVQNGGARVGPLLLAAQVVVALGRDLAPVAASLRTTVGLRNTIRLVFCASPRVVAEQRARRPGMSPSTGTLSVPSVKRSWIRPPSTMICWSSTTTDDSSARFDRIDARRRCDRRPGRATPPGRCTRRTVPPSVICGLHAQHEADVAALDGLERLDRRRRRRSSRTGR